jgi:hypothetical protein
MCARQNRQGDKANGGYFQKLQNNTQNINPRHSSNGGEMASQMDENKSAAVPAGFVAEEENSPIRPDLP